MKRVFGVLAISLFYMELVYHIACFGFTFINPVMILPSVVFLAGLQTLCAGFLRKKSNKIILWVGLAADYLIFASQLVYMSIFKQPLLAAAMTNAGKAAVTNYWREALHAILMSSGYLLLLALPLIVTGILLYKRILVLKSHRAGDRICAAAAMGAGLLVFVLVLVTGYFAKWEYYEEYQEFYDPSMVIERYGVLASVERDMLGGFLPESESVLEAFDGEGSGLEVSGGDNPDSAAPSEDSTAAEGAQEPEEEPLDTSPNVLAIDFDKLNELAPNEQVQKLAAYMQTMEPTKKNEYTGMFEGYNLIYLSAEGFSTYAVDEQLTPTLYKLINSGFVAEDYYVPLWQTSTSDGEYVNLTGLIPDQQFSMKRSAVNAEPFSLPAYFRKEGVKSYAYHNNTLSYYDRHLSHTNLGYDFKASKLGDLSEEEWGSQVFQMENANYWPASDLDMMKATIPEYINNDRFHVYYMTVSGHMNYNFTGNRMSSLNKEAVADLPYSEEGRAYIACNIELDKALQYLIEELEKAGKLENTVICLSADHYPYAMDMNNLEELAGKELEGKLEIYRNSLILWNSGMETVKIEKTCSALDIMPTLLNLFGFEYDSRLFAGRDMLSDSPSLVIFSDRSFITDEIMYNRKAKTTESRTEAPVDEEYFSAMKKQVKGIYEYSAGILNDDFYRYVAEALEGSAADG